MFHNYIRVALRNLTKHKLYSAINIIGLAIGLASCVLITLFVRDELSYDTFWKDADSVYRLNTTFEVPGREPFVTVMAMGPARAALQRYFPEEVAYTVRFNGESPVIEYDGKAFTEEVHWVDAEMLDIFSLETVSGDLRASLRDNATLAIDETFAQKHFGEENPIGKVMTMTFYSVTRDYRIGAVFKDLPHNTVLDFQAFVLIDEKDFEDNPWQFAQWFSTNSNLYFKLKDGASIDTINARLSDFADSQVPSNYLPPGAKAS